MFVGNYTGLLINDQGATGFQGGQNIQVSNNDFVYNTYGFNLYTTATSGPVLATLTNNIFWENRDNSGFRNGAAIVANQPNRLTVQYNLFSGNGPSEVSPADDTFNVGGGFDPSQIPTNGSPDAFGNIYGTPAFVSPIDPRPDASGPGNFFLGADFDIKLNSAAVDEALEADAPTLDFRYASRVAIPGRGRAGTGPADIGAFEYNGVGGVGTGTVGNTSGGSTTTPVNSGIAPPASSSSSSTVTTPTSSAHLTPAQKLKAKRAAAAAALAAKKAAAAAAKHASKPSGPSSLISKFRKSR